jgi:hypothetical protein
MKRLIGLLMLLAVLVGCSSLPNGEELIEGEVLEQAFDVPRVGRYWVIGSPHDIIINEDYVYWLKVRSREGATVWVNVTGHEWKTYKVGDWWVKMPEARVRYAPVTKEEQVQQKRYYRPSRAN